MDEMDFLLRRRDVEKATGLRRSTIYRLIQSKNFPMPLRISARSVAWRQSDIEKWIAARPPAREPIAAAPVPQRELR